MPTTNQKPATKKNIYLFHGTDSFSATQKLQHWKNEFEKKYSNINIQIFTGKEITASIFNEAVSTLPFLGDKRLVIIEDFLRDGDEEEQKRVADSLDATPEHCVIVFIERERAKANTTLFKRLSKLGHQTPFEERDLPELINWIKSESAKKGLRINHQEATTLANHVGPNLWQMNHELEKLALYAISNPIDEKAIERLTSQNIQANIFKLTDYINQKNSRMSLKTLNDLTMSGTPLMQIFHMIVRHFRVLIKIKACLNKKMNQLNITSRTGLHPFVVKKSVPQARALTENQLARIYRALLQIETDSKSNRIKITAADQTELRLSLEKLIVELCLKS
jgi:DNA polymerase-3 subunit delta